MNKEMIVLTNRTGRYRLLNNELNKYGFEKYLICVEIINKLSKWGPNFTKTIELLLHKR